MKHSIIISKIGEVTEKKNVTLTVTYKKGLVKQSLLLLTEEADVKDLKVGQDITDAIPENFKVRESEFISETDGTVVRNKWIELV